MEQCAVASPTAAFASGMDDMQQLDTCLPQLQDQLARWLSPCMEASTRGALAADFCCQAKTAARWPGGYAMQAARYRVARSKGRCPMKRIVRVALASAATLFALLCWVCGTAGAVLLGAAPRISHARSEIGIVPSPPPAAAVRGDGRSSST
jgi:hypothetical protein